MIESLLFLGELIVMGAFLYQVFKTEKVAKRLGGLFSYKDLVAKKMAPKGFMRPPGA